MKQHHYNVTIKWTGNDGYGTRDYRSYRRDHVISAGLKPEVPGSSDPAFRGDPERYNPEELLVASLSACHMLWYLHLCATHEIVLTDYHDEARGTMREHENGAGEFTHVVLRPKVTISSGDHDKAIALHHEAHQMCFIANSVKFPVEVEPEVRVESPVAGRLSS
ncbi:MAG TPA: OsmC family protein [Terriglobales bacterium]|nr:OsmC family protein [Terriglobales bacterium]